MIRSATIWIATLLLCPLTSRADEVDVPELGVRLTSLPSVAAKPQVTQQSAGYTLTTQIGPALLSIYRDNDPAPAGSDVADPGYRAKLDARFDQSVDSKMQGAPTNVGGHSGWTVVDVRAGASGATLYTCLTYVIVEQHLYRLTVRASGSPGRPAEFDSLVAAMSGVKFEPVQRSELPATQSAATFRHGYARNTLRAGRTDRQDHLRGVHAAQV
jgi:hypothetical protein